MISEKLLDFLNKAIARELQVSIQYMWQHVQVTGSDGAVVEDIFRKTAIAEMKHAERLAEQLDYLNGVPTVKPDPIFVGGSLIEMLTETSAMKKTPSNSTRRQFRRRRTKATTPRGGCWRRFWRKRKGTSTLLASCSSA